MPRIHGSGGGGGGEGLLLAGKFMAPVKTRTVHRAARDLKLPTAK